MACSCTTKSLCSCCMVMMVVSIFLSINSLTSRFFSLSLRTRLVIASFFFFLLAASSAYSVETSSCRLGARFSFPIKRHIFFLYHPGNVQYLHYSTHWGPVTYSCVSKLGHHWCRLWLVAWQHQAITCTNTDLRTWASFLVQFHGIHG